MGLGVLDSGLEAGEAHKPPPPPSWGRSDGISDDCCTVAGPTRACTDSNKGVEGVDLLPTALRAPHPQQSPRPLPTATLKPTPGSL